MGDCTPKVYAFIQSGRGTDWVHGMAMAEDGTVLAEHVSSHDGWAKHDMGATEHQAMHYQDYSKHYPDGFAVEWVDDPLTHEGLQAAYSLNQEAGRRLLPQPQAHTEQRRTT